MKRKPKTIPRQQSDNAIRLSTSGLLTAGAAVLGKSFGFTDKQQAQWIEETAVLARDRMLELERTLNDANEKLRKANK